MLVLHIIINDNILDLLSKFIVSNYYLINIFNDGICITQNLNKTSNFSIFLDTANLWGVDYDSSLDKSKIRSSTGVAIDWFTPIGPLSFSLAAPITKADSDETESFRFKIGTTF